MRFTNDRNLGSSGTRRFQSQWDIACIARTKLSPSRFVSGRLRNTQLGGDSLLPSPVRHAFVACLAVVCLSCAGQVNAQTPPRSEVLLRKMTLDEKLGQLVQRAGGRSKSLNSRLDDAELA